VTEDKILLPTDEPDPRIEADVERDGRTESRYEEGGVDLRSDNAGDLYLLPLLSGRLLSLPLSTGESKAAGFTDVGGRCVSYSNLKSGNSSSKSTSSSYSSARYLCSEALLSSCVTILFINVELDEPYELPWDAQAGSDETTGDGDRRDVESSEC
jgi:hypothetical protein